MWQKRWDKEGRKEDWNMKFFTNQTLNQENSLFTSIKPSTIRDNQCQTWNFVISVKSFKKGESGMLEVRIFLMRP